MAALSTVTSHEGDGERGSLILTQAPGSHPPPMQWAGVRPLSVRSAGMLLGGENGSENIRLGSTLGHAHGTAFAALEGWKNAV